MHQQKHMQKYYIIYKPVGMLSQFSTDSDKAILGDLFPFEKEVYPVGRLDADSEGLLVLTNDKTLNNRLLNPNNKHRRTYFVQVEGIFSEEGLKAIQQPLDIKLKKGKIHRTLPCRAEIIPSPEELPERNPPIRFRKDKPTSWISITLTEGKNRQVRKMTAKVGFPTLRLVRVSIENLTIGHLEKEQVKEMNKNEILQLLKI